MKRLFVVVCLASAVIVSKQLPAQNYLYATGNPIFSTQIPIENGFINVNNGEIHIEIPLATHSQRGSLQLNERLIYDSRIWKIVNGSGYSWQPTNVPNSMGGWVFSSGTATGTYSYGSLGGQVWCNPSDKVEGYYNYTQNVDWQWTDPQGTSHSFYYPTVQYTAPGQIPCLPQSQPSAGGWASDGSGYYMQITNYSNVVIYDKQGNTYHPAYVGTNPPANTPLIQDPNGNYFSQDTSGNLIDTLARTPVLTSTSGNQIYYDVLGYGGTRSRYTVTTETVNCHTDFGQSNVAEAAGSFTAIQSIQLPDGSAYSFTYDSGTTAGNFGELTSVTLPTGGVIQYTYQDFLDSFQNENRWLAGMEKDGGLTLFIPATISNCTSNSGCQEKVTVASPDNNETVYTFTLDPGSLANAGSWVTTVDAWQGSAGSGTKLVSQATNYTYQQYQEIKLFDNNGTISDNYFNYQVPSTVATTTTLSDVALTKKTEVDLVTTGADPSAVKDWDYYSGTAPSSPTRETDYVYGYSVNNAAFPSQIIVKDGAGNHVSETDYGYDETTGTGHAALQTTSGLSQHNSVSGNRGNVTTVAQWIDSSGATLSKEGAYDDAGTLLTNTDPNGITTYGHDASDAFTTSTTLPTPSSGVVLTYGNSVDFSTGLSTGQTDPNNTQNVPQGYDAFGRPTGFVVSNGGITYAKTSLSNTPTQSSDYEYQTASAYADRETLYDAYGRLSRVAVANGQSGNSWYQVDTCYDTTGRVNFQSYRYQANGFTSSKICSGAGDTYAYDALNRLKSITHGDGTSILYSYTGRATEVTDENGVNRISEVDALGRTTLVCEISSNSSMPGSGSPGACGTDISGTGFTMAYAYAMANHTTTVTQGVQSRTFQLDWLDWPTSVSEPESGTTSYSYAFNTTGLVVTRKRPRANQSYSSTLTTTTTQYDSLGRVVSISYDDGTPSKTFAYDASANWPDLAQNNLKGHISSAAVASAATIFGYDAVGRLTDLDECLPSAACGNPTYDKEVHYAYDLAGNLTSTTDGGGVTSTYALSQANEVLSITSSRSDATDPANLVSNVLSGPYGPIGFLLGNGLSGGYSYDKLGRLSGGWVRESGNPTSCPAIGKGYIFSNASNGDYLTKSFDSVLGQTSTYNYDEFGRMSARTVTKGTAQNFTWVYDRWGNRAQQNVTVGSGPQPQFSFNTANNQISGFTYDAAGNMTNDGSHSYTYDAEGDVTAVDNGSTAQYVYDAVNHRVRTVIGTTATEFVFDEADRRVSEWDGSTHAQLRGHYYWGGEPLAYYASGSIHFEHQDWLGTERMRTTYNGGVEGTYTSLPFGDAQTAASGSDLDPYHFAMLDYDSETNSDHAQFRQYNPTQGRWMAPDPYGGSYNIRNPQSFNRYSYALDNPLSTNDPSGLNGDLGGGCFFCLYFDPFSWLGILSGTPSFHGSLRPRPNVGGPTWDGNFGESLGISTKLPQMNLGIADALGLPDAGCEFGACGAGPSAFGPGQQGGGPGTLSSEFVFGVSWIYAKYQDMIKANVIGADRYFHCSAMWGAASIGPGGELAAHTMSWGREISDTFKYQALRLWPNKRTGTRYVPGQGWVGNGLHLADSLEDSMGDLTADYMGIRGANGSLAAACGSLKVKGLHE